MLVVGLALTNDKRGSNPTSTSVTRAEGLTVFQLVQPVSRTI